MSGVTASPRLIVQLFLWLRVGNVAAVRHLWKRLRNTGETTICVFPDEENQLYVEGGDPAPRSKLGDESFLFDKLSDRRCC